MTENVTDLGEYQKEVRNRLIDQLRNPVNHKVGLASTPMLEAAQFLIANGDERDEELIAKLQNPDNHQKADLTMPMLIAAKRLEEMS